jgi:prophage regulatory protein
VHGQRVDDRIFLPNCEGIHGSRDRPMKKSNGGRANKALLRRMLTIEQVLEIVPVSRRTLLRMEKEGRFPAGHFISDRKKVWYLDGIEEWLTTLPTRKDMANQRAASATTWLSFADLQARGIIHSRAMLKARIDYDGFPPGRAIGPNIQTWTEAEIQEWLASRTVKAKPEPDQGDQNDDVIRLKPKDKNTKAKPKARTRSLDVDIGAHKSA